MARVAVDVVIKPEILDPQGKAILAALARTGHSGVRSVRQGKHFDLEVDDTVSDEDLKRTRSLATIVGGSVAHNEGIV